MERGGDHRVGRAGFREVGRRRGGFVSDGQRCDAVLMDAIAPDFSFDAT